MRRSLGGADDGAGKLERSRERSLHVCGRADHRARAHAGPQRHRASEGASSRHNGSPYGGRRHRGPPRGGGKSARAGPAAHVSARRRVHRTRPAGARGGAARGGGAAGDAAALEHQRGRQVARRAEGGGARPPPRRPPAPARPRRVVTVRLSDRAAPHTPTPSN